MELIIKYPAQQKRGIQTIQTSINKEGSLMKWTMSTVTVLDSRNCYAASSLHERGKDERFRITLVPQVMTVLTLNEYLLFPLTLFWYCPGLTRDTATATIKLSASYLTFTTFVASLNPIFPTHHPQPILNWQPDKVYVLTYDLKLVLLEA